MVSPRPRRAVVLPAPATYTALRRVLAAKIAATSALWAAPALLLPVGWFPVFGIPEPPPAHEIFVRLLGASYVALIVGYALAWRAPLRHPGAVLVGAVSNGLASLVIFSVGARGGFASWDMLGAIYIWGSALITAALAVALVVTGRPLFRKLAAEGQRSSTVKAT